MILFLFFFAALVALIIAGYWYESSPWRWCRRCGRYWHIKTGRKFNYLPGDSDGICQQRECESCNSTKPKP